MFRKGPKVFVHLQTHRPSSTAALSLAGSSKMNSSRERSRLRAKAMVIPPIEIFSHGHHTAGHRLLAGHSACRVGA